MVDLELRVSFGTLSFGENMEVPLLAGSSTCHFRDSTHQVVEWISVRYYLRTSRNVAFDSNFNFLSCISIARSRSCSIPMSVGSLHQLERGAFPLHKRLNSMKRSSILPLLPTPANATRGSDCCFEPTERAHKRMKSGSTCFAATPWPRVAHWLTLLTEVCF